MVRDSHSPAWQLELDAPKIQESQQHRSGEGAASALASMKKQVRQLRREAGKTEEDRTGSDTAMQAMIQKRSLTVAASHNEEIAGNEQSGLETHDF